jgi:hypothetical protein
MLYLDVKQMLVIGTYFKPNAYFFRYGGGGG